MNEIELARRCEEALARIPDHTWPWMWQHVHPDGTVCQDQRIVYEVHPDDWTEAEVATFNATVQARVGETVTMMRSEATPQGMTSVFLLPVKGWERYPPGCPARKLVR